ncbi:MAG: hypothetical protein ACTHJS_06235 [Xanthobacteraceae bacterium]|jgi:hypothetical protein
MADTPDSAAGGGAVAANETDAARINLPAVVAPQLSGAADQAEIDAADTSEQSKSAAPVRSKRFVMLAASVAFAAGFGSFVGSVSGSGLARFIYPPPQAPAPASGLENTVAAMREIKLELAQVAALKASVDNTARNTINQYAKIADRLDRIDQRGSAAAETTGSLPTQTAALAASAPAAEPAKLSDRVLPDWVVHGVRNGHALVESRYAGLFAVSAGSVLPGIGRVDEIRRQDGHWVVLTARGTISSAR